MTYRELLQLYKKGQLDETTRARVEQDIQRQDAIGEYLFEESEIPTLEDAGEEELPIPEENAEFVNLIQKSIRRAFWKLGISVCAVVLAGALLAVFVLPKVVDLFYYNPTEVVGREAEHPNVETDRMSLDLAVWTELFTPGTYRDQVIATPQGYGSYDLMIPQGSSWNGSYNTLGGSLVRNRLTLYDPNVLKRPTGNAFVYPGEEEYGPYESRERSFAAVDGLEEDTWYQGFVSLSEITDYADFINWYQSLELEGWRLWCAVYTDDGDDGAGGYSPIYKNVGFVPWGGGYVLQWDQETYPLLSLVGEDVAVEDSAAMTTHFTSMVRYLADHPEIGELLECGLNSHQAEHMLESIERDGLRIYGFSITAQKDAFELLREDPHVNYLYTTPAR